MSKVCLQHKRIVVDAVWHSCRVSRVAFMSSWWWTCWWVRTSHGTRVMPLSQLCSCSLVHITEPEWIHSNTQTNKQLKQDAWCLNNPLFARSSTNEGNAQRASAINTGIMHTNFKKQSWLVKATKWPWLCKNFVFNTHEPVAKIGDVQQVEPAINGLSIKWSAHWNAHHH